MLNKELLMCETKTPKLLLTIRYTGRFNGTITIRKSQDSPPVLSLSVSKGTVKTTTLTVTPTQTLYVFTPYFSQLSFTPEDSITLEGPNLEDGGWGWVVHSTENANILSIDLTGL